METDAKNNIVNNNIVMNGFGPQLLLLEVMLGAKGKTHEEISDAAKISSHSTLTRFNEYLKVAKQLNDFKIRISSFATSTATYVSPNI